MRNARGISAMAVAALAVALLAGCSEDSTGSTTPTESPTSSPAPTSTTVKPPTDSELAQEAATQVVRDYFATVDHLRQDPQRPVADLKAVTIGGELAAQEIFTRNQRKIGNRQVGDSKVVDVVVQSVNLDNSDPKAGKFPTVHIDVCWDVSEVDVLDSDGKSIVSPDRPDRGWTSYTVANHQWTAHKNNAWRVSSGRDLKKAPCSAA